MNPLKIGERVVCQSRVYGQKGPGKSVPAGTEGVVVERWTEYQEMFYRDPESLRPVFNVVLVEFDGGMWGQVNENALRRVEARASKPLQYAGRRSRQRSDRQLAGRR